MNISVGRLYSGDKFRGSAWMVSAGMSLTAYHCVLDKNGQVLPDLNIKFSEFQEKISIVLNEFNTELDVALLKVTSGPDLSKIVVSLSNQTLMPGDKVKVYGHAESFMEVYQQGFPLTLEVADPEVLVKNCPRVDLIYHGGDTPDIQGMSGSPMVLNSEVDFALGILTSELMEGQKVHVSSIIKQIEVIQELREALEKSPYVNSNSDTLVIDRDANGNIIWSCSVSLDEVALLMGDQTPINKVICLADFSDLGNAVYSLRRLLWHGRFNDIKCHGADIQLAMLRKEHQKIENISHVVSSWSDVQGSERYSSPFTKITEEDFCQKINGAINSDMLKRLHLVIEECDADSTRRVDLIGVNPDSTLWDEMFRIWTDWKSVLDSDNVLNQQYLSHCLFTSACAEASHKKLVSLGRNTSIERFFKPTITALALAASNISVEPNNSCVGNIEIEDLRGHATGIGKFDFGSIVFAAQNIWNTKAVILPYLQKSFFECWKKRESMNHSSMTGTKLNDQGLPPLVISGDEEWLKALGAGSFEVQSYYKKRVAEIQQHKDSQVVGSRDGGMEHAS